MLFQSITARQPGIDVEQVLVTLPEGVDAAALERAWEGAVARHEILRTAFRWEGLPQPRQEVSTAARAPWTREDWRGTAPAAQHRMLEDFLETDRRRGFDLAAAPLFRLALFRTGPAEYRFVWTFHHLLIDGRAIFVVLNEVFAAYEALRRGEAPALPPAAAYRDYIAWLGRREVQASAPFWREYLAGFAAPTPLPFAAAASARSESTPGEAEIVLSRPLTEACESLARDSGVTMNTVLLGAWGLLLGRYAGTDEAVFGAVRAGRHVPVAGAADLAGLLINTLPFRVRLPGATPVRAWLQGLRRDWVALRPHEQSSLVDIQGWSDVPRGAPLFETLFNFQDPGWDGALQAQGGAWESRACGIRSQPGYPLTVDAYGGPALRIKLLHDRAIFDPAGIARLLANFQATLVELSARADAVLAEIAPLAPAERAQVLEGWNRTGTAFRDDVPVHVLVEEQAARVPASLALAGEAGSLTYGGLDREAARIARRLRPLGVGPESLVAIFMDRGPEMVAALLGTWKAGGAYLPVDPEYPRERIEFMLQDARVAVVLTSQALASRLPATAGRVVCVDQLTEEGVAAGEHENGARGVRGTGAGPDNLAYVIYTSGSTGTPKGVAVTHRNLANLIGWHQRTYQVTQTDRASQLASPAFDAAVWEIWPYLAAGASVHFPDEETRLAPARLLRWLEETQVSLAFLPTPLAEAALAESWPDRLALRAVLTGGDQLHRRPDDAFPALLVNHYGPTECTVVATWGTVDPAGTDPRPPAIGRPIANTEAYVLDPQLRPVPIGATGELFLGGAGLARGYLHRPELTAERFVAHPFRPGARLYRTGDAVRWTGDGELEFLGRLDSQVKIRGHRIELGEIEAALGAHAGLRQGVVVLHQPARGEKRLVAYLVAAPGAAPAADELRRFLRERLPEAMVPTAFVTRDELPLTPNGKIDRRALAALPPPSSAAAAGEPPRTATERALAAIWAELLQVEGVGRSDNFFELGGHSLLATQVVARVRAAFDVSIAVHAFFAAPTVAGLAERIDREARTSAGRPAGIRRRTPVAARACVAASPAATAAPAEVGGIPILS